MIVDRAKGNRSMTEIGRRVTYARILRGARDHNGEYGVWSLQIPQLGRS